jgi:Flp pilus assembly protein TadG
MTNRLWQWARQRKGVAAVEFALIAPVLLIILGGLTDFGLVFGDQIRLDHAVSNGATYAFVAQQSASSFSSVSAASVQAVVQAATSLSPVTVQIEGPEAGCIQTNSSSTPPTSSLCTATSTNCTPDSGPPTYGTPCPNGNPVGTYMVITAQYAYQPLMPFYSRLGNTTLSATATVRLY